MKKAKDITKKHAVKAHSASSEKSVEHKPIKTSAFSLKYRLALFCAVIGFLLYANTLQHDYAGDDGMVIKNNKITTQGIKAIPEIFKTGYREGFWDRKENFYRPLSLVMFAIEYEIAPANPHINHFMNVLLYALTGFILFITLASLMQGKNLIIPLIATVLFIAHPIHTEVVANIKSRDEILSLLFTICSFYFLSIYLLKQTRLSMALSGFFFFLALLSKESAITCVAIAPLICWFFGKSNSVKGLIVSFLTFSAASLLYLTIRYLILQGFTNFEEIAAINNSLVKAPDLISRLATAIMILGKYILILFFPHPLSSDYSFNQIPNVGIGNIYVLLSLAIYAGMVIYSIITFRSKNQVAFGILFFLITISLVSNILFLIESTMSERFLYLASIGFCIAVALLMAKLFKTNIFEKTSSFNSLFSKNRALFGIVAIVFILFSYKTISRNADWKNDLTLLKKDAASTPQSARVHYAYGRNILVDKAQQESDPVIKNEDLDKAIEQLEKSISILPSFGDPYYYLGIAYKEKGNYSEAIRDFELARKNNYFEDANFPLQMGIAYASLNQYENAIREMKQATILNPQSFDAYLNLGVYYVNTARYVESIEALKHASEIDPKSSKPYYNTGNTYSQMGKFNEAIEWYKKSAELDPNSSSAYNNVANCYVALKDYPHAIENYKKALAIVPGNKEILNNLEYVSKLAGNAK